MQKHYVYGFYLVLIRLMHFVFLWGVTTYNFQDCIFNELGDTAINSIVMLVWPSQ